jgi:hypothetical protein
MELLFVSFILSSLQKIVTLLKVNQFAFQEHCFCLPYPILKVTPGRRPAQENNIDQAAQ